MIFDILNQKYINQQLAVNNNGKITNYFTFYKKTLEILYVLWYNKFRLFVYNR